MAELRQQQQRARSTRTNKYRFVFNPRAPANIGIGKSPGTETGGTLPGDYQHAPPATSLPACSTPATSTPALTPATTTRRQPTPAANRLLASTRVLHGYLNTGSYNTDCQLGDVNTGGFITGNYSNGFCGGAITKAWRISKRSPCSTPPFRWLHVPTFSISRSPAHLARSPFLASDSPEITGDVFDGMVSPHSDALVLEHSIVPTSVNLGRRTVDLADEDIAGTGRFIADQDSTSSIPAALIRELDDHPGISSTPARVGRVGR